MIERTFVLIKTGALSRCDSHAIFDALIMAGFTIVEFNSFVGEDIFKELYKEHEGRPYHSDLIASVTPCSIGLVLERESAINAWRYMMGPTDPVKARAEAPLSLRAQFGGEALPDNAVHGSDSPEAAAREIALFFPHSVETASEATAP